MGTALTLIILACAGLLIWAFITGRVSAATRKTYLPQGPSGEDPASRGVDPGGTPDAPQTAGEPGQDPSA